MHWCTELLTMYGVMYGAVSKSLWLVGPWPVRQPDKKKPSPIKKPGTEAGFNQK
jgi:hypothetical protein